MQLIAEKEKLIVVASIVVHYCAIKKNVIVASQLYDTADEQFTLEKEGPLELFQFIQKYNLGNSVPSTNAADFSNNCRLCWYLLEEFFETKTDQELLKI